jgi:hypothetical protein
VTASRVPLVVEKDGRFSVELTKGARLIWWDAGEPMVVRIETDDDGDSRIEDEAFTER